MFDMNMIYYFLPTFSIQRGKECTPPAGITRLHSSLLGGLLYVPRTNVEMTNWRTHQPQCLCFASVSVGSKQSRNWCLSDKSKVIRK